MSENIELEANGSKSAEKLLDSGNGNEAEHFVREKSYLSVPSGGKIFCRYWKPLDSTNVKVSWTFSRNL